MTRELEIPVDQGVEYGNDPDTVTPGGLLIARNCYYEPETGVLRMWRGRALFGTVAAARGSGLEFVSFRNGDKFLVGKAGTALATAPAGLSGSFTSRKTLGSALGQMEARYFDPTDRVYIFDGVNAPQVWTGSGNTRDMGIAAPTTAIVLSLLSDGGTTYPAGTTFSYIITEYDPTNDVESGPSPVATIALASATQTIKLTLPTVASSASRFRIYRTQGSGAVFFRLAEVVSTTEHYYDGTDSEGLANGLDNVDEWGFATFDDIFLATQPLMPMLGTPLESNYITVNGTVPNGDILCVFEESLVVAGVPGYGQDVYYSLPNQPESFSPVYFYREGTKLGTPVRGLGVANDRLLVFTVGTVTRYNRLARITDPSFGIGGTTRQEVAGDHGIVGKRALAQFSVGAPNDRILYWSQRGPYVTDAYVTQPVGQDLDYSKRAMNHDRLSSIVCRNFPRYRAVLCMMSSPGSTRNDIGWLYHYDRLHTKKTTGVGKWTGPFHLRANTAAVAIQSDVDARLYTLDDNDSGQVYVEDEGGGVDASLYENANGDIRWEWKTGAAPIGGMARNKRVGRVFLSHEGVGSFAPEFHYSMNKANYENRIDLENQTDNEAATETLGTTEIDQVQSRTYRGGIHQSGTHLQLHMQEMVNGQERGVVALSVEVDDLGPQR